MTSNVAPAPYLVAQYLLNEVVEQLQRQFAAAFVVRDRNAATICVFERMDPVFRV